jgi:hypothetical protein
MSDEKRNLLKPTTKGDRHDCNFRMGMSTIGSRLAHCGLGLALTLEVVGLEILAARLAVSGITQKRFGPKSARVRYELARTRSERQAIEIMD